jgi:hypothetical protein
MKNLPSFVLQRLINTQQKVYVLVYELRGTETLFSLKQSKFNRNTLKIIYYPLSNDKSIPKKERLKFQIKMFPLSLRSG